jgi:hypothetical protein
MADLPAFKTTVLPAQADDVLEVDEIFRKCLKIA